MEKTKKWNKFSKSKILIFVVIAFVLAPLFINVGLVITDIIYEKTGLTLTALGLNNADWLDFWQQYLAIVISFLGIYLVYISASMDRENQLREKNAQQYFDKVRQEENVLVEVTRSFNTGVVYEALLKQKKTDIYEGRMVLVDARTRMDYVHIKFEILTELCDDFKKCEKCSFSPCIDKKIMRELRDLFYDMEKHYFCMLEVGENFLERLNQEQERIKSLDIQNSLYSNTSSLIRLCERQGLLEEADTSRTELGHIKETIDNLEKSKLKSDEINKLIVSIQKEIDHIGKEMRPKFIRHCKEYIDIKKAHATDLRTIGYIRYDKMDDKKY